MIRYLKTVNGVTTVYYRDGNKILGEDRSDGKKLRYMYDTDGVIGFRYHDGTKWTDFTYVKDMHGSVIMIRNGIGAPLVRYGYDLYGKRYVYAVTANGYDKPEYADVIGSINPFGWKGHYYDGESGYYYIDGRYYDPDEGTYIDAEPIENMLANAENVYGLDRHTAWYDNAHGMSGYAYTIELLTGLNASNDKNVITEYTLSHEKAWWSWIPSAIELAAGIVMMCTPLYVAGIGLAVTGAIGLTGNIAAIQTLGGASMVSNGLQSVFNGIRLMSGACNPVSVVLGMVGVIAGVAGMAFGTAEVQEGLGYGNWIKDSGMSEGLYERSMLITGAVSLFVNIAGPIANKYGAKCFAVGTAVHTKTGLKAIEEIEVGEEVLSYDEETGMQGYKPVVRLYRNVTEEWYVIRVNGEELRCTAEHPFYVVKRDEFVPARNLKKGDELLQSDGRYGIIESVEVERLAKPEVTYNFEVAEYHTYYVGSGILTHNKCRAQAVHDAKSFLNIEDDAIFDGSDIIRMKEGVNGKPYNAKVYRYGDKWIRDDMGGHRFFNKITKSYDKLQSHLNVGYTVNGVDIQYRGLHFFYR